MQIPSTIFRGYDIRGLVGSELTPEVYYNIGRAYGTYLHQLNITRAAVGHDCRLNSAEYARKFVKGILSTGVDVHFLGLTMIGIYYWAQYFLDSPGGAFITASHNPKEYNGLKMASGLSESLTGDEIQNLRLIIENDQFFTSETPGSLIEKSVNEDYFSNILSRFDVRSNIKVLLDPSCTTAGILAPDLFRRFGCTVIEKNCQIDGNFPLGTPDPTESEVVSRLGDETVKSSSDIGLTFDADGDRLGMVDELGHAVWNDVLLCLFAQDVLNLHPGSTIMYNTLCSKVVEDTIIKYDGKPFMWRTGYANLKKKNHEVKATFIGELSGHFFFSADFYNHDDGLYSALRLIAYLSKSGKTLSQLVNELPKYFSSPEIKVGCPDNLKVDLMAKIATKLKIDFPEAEVIDDERAGDGVRLNLSYGMFVIRYSQNGPYITVKFEASTEAEYTQLKNYIRTTLKSYPEIDWSFGVNVDSLV